MRSCPNPSCCKSNPDDHTFCGYCGKKLVTGDKRRRPKSANGQGSVIRLSGRRAKPWAAYGPAVKDSNGKYTKPFVDTFATEGEARSAILLLPAVARTDMYNFTVEQVYNEWKDEHFRAIGQKGREGYENSWANLSTAVIFPGGESYPIHNKKARALTKLDFQQIINALSKSGKSLSKCQKVRQLSNQICRWCVDHDLLPRNVAENLTMPKAESKEKRIFTDAEIDLIEIEARSNDPVRKRIAQITLILCYTGFRVGALTQMKIGDVHLDEDIAGQTVSYMIGGVKTEAGKNRLVPINKRVLPIARELVADKPPDAPLFEDLPTERNLRHHFTSLVADIGASGATIHSCRHTYATKHARAETRPEILSKLMGHTNYDITKIYTHSTILDLAAADSKIK